MSDSIRDRLAAEEAQASTAPGFDEHDNRSHGGSATPPAVEGQSGSGDPKDTRGAERAVAALFLLSVVGVVGFVVSFIAVPFDYGSSNYQWYTPALGLFMAVALLGLGSGAILWSKTVMNDPETVQERHHLASTDDSKSETAEILKSGFADTGLPRRSLLRNSLLLGAGSLAVLPVPLLFGLGKYQHKEKVLSETGWKKGSRLLDELGRPVKLGDLEVGGVKSVFPDVPGGRRMADSAALIIRMKPEDLYVREARKDWVHDGHIVYSVICTHLGCPVKLYEQQTHHLFCPCHQSTFDAAREAKVLFGPAARNLPQLAIALDDEGYFIAQGDFNEPVGPSFWERKPSYPDKVG